MPIDTNTIRTAPEVLQSLASAVRAYERANRRLCFVSDTGRALAALLEEVKDTYPAKKRYIYIANTTNLYKDGHRVASFTSNDLGQLLATLLNDYDET